MLLYNCPVSTIDNALAVANKKYDGNLKIRIAGQRGRATSFRLVVNSSHAPGAKVSAMTGRHIAAACWHAHRDFMVALFNLAPDARLKTAVAYYKGRDDFAAKFEATGRKNVGSMMSPCEYRHACECGSETQFGTLTPEGKLVNVRMIRQRDLMRCPFCILDPSHYREDGTCRCNDATHTEMKEWGYRWTGTRWAA